MSSPTWTWRRRNVRFRTRLRKLRRAGWTLTWHVDPHRKHIHVVTLDLTPPTNGSTR